MIGDKIKELRRASGLTQLEFAVKLGKTPSAISQLEHGKRKPSYDTLQKLISRFHMSPDKLFEEGK